MTQMEYFKNGIERGKKLAFIFRPVLDILLSKMQFLKSFYFYCRICEEVKVTGGSKARKVVRQKDWVMAGECRRQEADKWGQQRDVSAIILAPNPLSRIYWQGLSTGLQFLDLEEERPGISASSNINKQSSCWSKVGWESNCRSSGPCGGVSSIPDLVQWVQRDPVLPHLQWRLQLRLGFNPLLGNSLCCSCSRKIKTNKI